MSHEIEKAVFMASEGAGWTGLGKAIPAEIAKDPRQIAEFLGATWTVETREAFYKDAKGAFAPIPGSAVQVRSDTGRALSITSDSRYHVTNRQPCDVFEAFRDELAAHHMDISHAAVLRGGQQIAVSAVLNNDHDITVGRGDKLKSYVTLSTGYDKKHGTKATKGTIRVVCANTLAASLKMAADSDQLRVIRASTQLEFDSLRELVANVKELEAAEAIKFNQLANWQMSDADVARYFASVLEINIDDLGKKTVNGKDAVSTKSRNMLTALTNAYETAPGAAIATGSAWGALNAVTYYATHEKTVRDTTDDGATLARIASNISGDSAKLKHRALQMLSDTQPELSTLLRKGESDFSRLMMQ